MRTPARILVVDDMPENLDIVRIRLESQGYEVAESGQILVSQRVFAAIEDVVDAEPVEGLELKGFSHAMTAHAVASVREAAPS